MNERSVALRVSAVAQVNSLKPPVQRLAADILTGSAELCQTVTLCLKCTDGSIKAAQRASVVKVSGT